MSRQDLTIRSLKRENSLINKQLEAARLVVAEKDEEVESQAQFIDTVKDQVATSHQLRDLNSRLQLKLNEAEQQAKDAFQQLADLQELYAVEKAQAEKIAESLQYEIDELRGQVQDLSRKASKQFRPEMNIVAQNTPSDMSSFANEVKYQLMNQHAPLQINMLNQSMGSQNTPVQNISNVNSD